MVLIAVVLTAVVLVAVMLVDPVGVGKLKEMLFASAVPAVVGAVPVADDVDVLNETSVDIVVDELLSTVEVDIPRPVEVLDRAEGRATKGNAGVAEDVRNEDVELELSVFGRGAGMITTVVIKDEELVVVFWKEGACLNELKS